MKLTKSILYLFLPLIFISSGAFASEHQTVAHSSEPVKVRLLSEEESIQPGRPFWVGVELKMADGWDTYWVNPGDSGFPTQVHWQLPEGFKAGPLHWPYPEKFISDSLVAFGYTDTVVLLTQITPAQNLPADKNIEIKANVNWLACKDSCVPGSADLSLSLPVSDMAPKASTATASLFENTRQVLPKKLSQQEVSVSTHNEEIVLNFHPKNGSFGEITDLLFIPEEGEVVDYSAPQVFKKVHEGMVLNVKRAHPEGTMPSLVKGVLLVSEKGTTIKKAIQIESSLNSSAISANDAPVKEVASVGVALGLAFLGGLILNVMPCVLPVIALKIFGFVKMAHQKRSLVLKHGAVFSFGVLISFWILAGGLFILRAYGEGVGWGFQLQEPMFVAVLAAVLFLLGLSLFGVFELGTSLISLGSKAQSSASSPLGSSFMSGVLATLVATPCTGPLLGPALGFAMTLPPVQGLLIFTSMGLGMASPYLLFSAFPKLVKYLPKPGNWMISFKQIMGFLMMATVVWLVWVFGAQTDNMGTFVLMGSLLLLAIGAWIFGTWGTPARKKRTRAFAVVAAALMLFTGGGAALMTAKQYREVSTQPQSGIELVSDHGWSAYSPERVAELRAQGVPVFVDFTAKWCLICQANKVILHSSEMQKAFADKGVVTMMADWTKKDPVITQELQKLGRTGVPVYVLYPGDEKPAYILPQTLTTNVVREYLNKLSLTQATVYAD